MKLNHASVDLDAAALGADQLRVEHGDLVYGADQACEELLSELLSEANLASSFAARYQSMQRAMDVMPEVTKPFGNHPHVYAYGEWIVKFSTMNPVEEAISTRALGVGASRARDPQVRSLSVPDVVMAINLSDTPWGVIVTQRVEGYRQVASFGRLAAWGFYMPWQRTSRATTYQRALNEVGLPLCLSRRHDVVSDDHTGNTLWPEGHEPSLFELPRDRVRVDYRVPGLLAQLTARASSAARV